MLQLSIPGVKELSPCVESIHFYYERLDRERFSWILDVLAILLGVWCAPEVFASSRRATVPALVRRLEEDPSFLLASFRAPPIWGRPTCQVRRLLVRGYRVVAIYGIRRWEVNTRCCESRTLSGPLLDLSGSSLPSTVREPHSWRDRPVAETEFRWEGRKMVPTLTRQVVAGASNARLRFGIRGTPSSAERLHDRGRHYFGNADSDCVAVVATNDKATVEVLLGAITAATRVLSLPTPGRAADLDGYVDLVRRAQAGHGAHEVVARDDVAQALSTVGIIARPHSEIARAPLAASRPEGFSLVQYSSGSTADPKAILHDDESLGTNVAAIIDAIKPRPGDSTVSWLPLSHDMGLVGILFTGIASCAPGLVGPGEIVLLAPQDFLRSPNCWIAAMSEFQASITATPDFGLRLATNNAATGEVNLSSMRCLIVGGELVRADTLARFVSCYEGAGLRRDALCPSYGLAEAGVAVTMTRPEESWSSIALASDALGRHRLEGARKDSRAVTLVSNGSPLSGYKLDCPTDGDIVGPIAISGPSIGRDATNDRRLDSPDHWFRTGDLGFRRHGSLYLCGRGDDYVVARGLNLYAPAIEASLNLVGGIREGRTVACGLPDGRWVIAAELQRSAANALTIERAKIRRELRRAAVDAVGIQPDNIILLQPGNLPMTSSGKIQRSEAGRRLSQHVTD